MSGIEIALLVGAAAATGSAYMSYQAAEKQEDVNNALRLEEQNQLMIQSRLDHGDTLAQVSGLGVSAQSASISKFLIAQRSQLDRDLDTSKNMASLESDLYSYNKSKALFDTTSAIANVGYTYKTMTNSSNTTSTAKSAV